MADLHTPSRARLALNAATWTLGGVIVLLVYSVVIEDMAHSAPIIGPAPWQFRVLATMGFVAGMLATLWGVFLGVVAAFTFLFDKEGK